MSLNFVLDLLPWVLPPFIGAMIGYITNVLAIRMLFRPLTEKRILGIRVPLTPGIIPKQRYELAESIGRMVSRELITGETIKRQLSTENFQNRLLQNIDSLMAKLLTTPLGSFQKGDQDLLFSTVEKFLSESLFRFFSSRSFIYAVREILTSLVHSISKKHLEDIFKQVNVKSVLTERIIPLLTSGELRKKIAQTVENWFYKQRQDDAPLSNLIPEEIIFLASDLLSTLFPVLFDSIFRWLREDSTSSELRVRGKRLLRDIIDKLNLVQKFLVSAGQFDITLEQKIPEIVDDALAALEEAAYKPEIMEKLKKVIEKSLLKWREKGAAELFSGINTHVSVGKVVENGLKVLEQENIQNKIADSLERLIYRQKQKTIKEVLTRYLGVREQDAVEFISFQVLNYLSKRESSQAIASEIVSFAMRFLEEQRDNSIGKLLHIEESAQKRAAVYLTGKLILILDQRIPALIQSFDIQELVVTKINQLNVAEVEKLLLMVISKHLKWINLFGAILGAIIGVSQIILSLLS